MNKSTNEFAMQELKLAGLIDNVGGER